MYNLQLYVIYYFITNNNNNNNNNLYSYSGYTYRIIIVHNNKV